MDYKRYKVTGKVDLSKFYKAYSGDIFRKELQKILPPNQEFTIDENIESTWKDKGTGKICINYKITLMNEKERGEEDFKRIKSRLEELFGGELIEIE